MSSLGAGWVSMSWSAMVMVTVFNGCSVVMIRFGL